MAVPPRGLDALAHPAQAIALGLAREAGAVVLHRDLEPARDGPGPHPCPARAGVADHVRQGLLDGPVGRVLRRVVEAVDDAGRCGRVVHGQRRRGGQVRDEIGQLLEPLSRRPRRVAAQHVEHVADLGQGLG
ncbi:hypothetical protein ACQ3I4_00585 [Zafaria sp. Z1313]|uniref:hypothetical protein n=1 Tax=Zafaria sp. Z1313 TaxID=3423202 RepID=UPI003D302D72